MFEFFLRCGAVESLKPGNESICGSTVAPEISRPDSGAIGPSRLFLPCQPSVDDRLHAILFPERCAELFRLGRGGIGVAYERILIVDQRSQEILDLSLMLIIRHEPYAHGALEGA